MLSRYVIFYTAHTNEITWESELIIMEQIVENFFIERNSKASTRANYKLAFNHYTRYCGMSMEALLDEADAEEEKGIRMKKRTLKSRLLGFRTEIFSSVGSSTAKLYFNCVKTFYRHYEVEIPHLPYMKVETMNVIKHEDIPTRDEIKTAYDYADGTIKAIMLFICSSGCARTEILNLTISDFMSATDEFSSNGEVLARCEELLGNDSVIPIWEVHRQKTDKDYFTYSSVEATHELCRYLLNRKDVLTMESKLFKIDKQYLNVKFRNINRLLGGKSCGAWAKFRPHTLRKFHASTLINCDENGFTIDEVDAVQGRSKDMTHRTYFLEDPTTLREKYRLIMHELTILSDAKLLEDYEEMKSQKEILQSQIESQEEKLELMMSEMKKLQEVLKVE